MAQQLYGDARWIRGEDDAAAFHARWQSWMGRFQRRFWWLDPARILDALGDALVRRLQQMNGELDERHKASAILADTSLYDLICHLIRNGQRTVHRRRCREQEHVQREKTCSYDDGSVHPGSWAEHRSEANSPAEELERLLSVLKPWEREFVDLRRQGMGRRPFWEGPPRPSLPRSRGAAGRKGITQCTRRQLPNQGPQQRPQKRWRPYVDD